MNPDYTVEFFRQFILVMNALDNRGEIILIFLSIFPFLHNKVIYTFSINKNISLWVRPSKT